MSRLCEAGAGGASTSSRTGIGVVPALMIGDVDHLRNLGDRVGDRDLDPLGQSHARHCASLAATSETKEGRDLLARDQLGPAPVGFARRTDLVLPQLAHALCYVTGELRNRT